MGKSLTEKDFEQIESWIGTGPKTFNLLYSITMDGCDASVFHQKCDNQGPTLTVLYNKESSVYGGYTGLSWESGAGSRTDNSAFLYQMYFSGLKTLKKCSVKIGKQSLIQHHTWVRYLEVVLCITSIIQKSSSGEYNLNGNMQLHFGKNYDTAGISSKEFNNGHIRVTELDVYAVKGVAELERRSQRHSPARRTRRATFHLLLGPLGSGIPQAALITKIDKLCEQSAENNSNTFLSPAVKELVYNAADLLNLPRNSILPVKNYEEEMESDENINILALLAVRQILFFAEDYL
ncbi:IF44L-like protein [Mya arenaria]|uniref:IF44L-like protein n=1 Tax=Mya arenaria TaxID=6604 RepID=A0ABY7D9X7_MYAAR|nr:IF44L-like protein [Mya arenaria]